MLTPWQRLGLGILASCILVVIGIVGYILIEDFGTLDAAFQTVTTITTAGFGQIHPLSAEGKLFTIFLIILGVLIILYVLTAVMQVAMEGELEAIIGGRRLKLKIKNLQNHYILCGFGRVGEESAKELTAREANFVVVDSNPQAVTRAREAGYLVIEGD
ncbi:MAG TPA: ion channel, partial [Dehalococcoidia bacterium]|nr:ion channel [Dehalococcoidia bacterium]